MLRTFSTRSVQLVNCFKVFGAQRDIEMDVIVLLVVFFFLLKLHFNQRLRQLVIPNHFVAPQKQKNWSIKENYQFVWSISWNVLHFVKINAKFFSFLQADLLPLSWFVFQVYFRNENGFEIRGKKTHRALCLFPLINICLKSFIHWGTCTKCIVQFENNCSIDKFTSILHASTDAPRE